MTTHDDLPRGGAGKCWLCQEFESSEQLCCSRSLKAVTFDNPGNCFAVPETSDYILTSDNIVLEITNLCILDCLGVLVTADIYVSVISFISKF